MRETVGFKCIHKISNRWVDCGKEYQDELQEEQQVKCGFLRFTVTFVNLIEISYEQTVDAQ